MDQTNILSKPLEFKLLLYLCQKLICTKYFVVYGKFFSGGTGENLLITTHQKRKINTVLMSFSIPGLRCLICMLDENFSPYLQVPTVSALLPADSIHVSVALCKGSRRRLLLCIGPYSRVPEFPGQLMRIFYYSSAV